MLLSVATAGASREVAITIDDLPRGGDGGGRTFAEIRGMTERLLAPLREQKIPVTGFVHPGRTELAAPDLRRILDLWLDAGADLGNHTWSHADLNRTCGGGLRTRHPQGGRGLRPVVEARGKKLEFFRYPMLHTGPTAETKRAIAEFLAAHGYRNAPVTFDNSDYMFAAAYVRPELRARVTREYVPYLESVVAFFERRSVEVVGREFPQIMLLHASETEFPDDAGHPGDVPPARLPVCVTRRRAAGRAPTGCPRTTWGLADSHGSTAGR
jgi:peptidoglycan/xylan/chitin deacetylase (PgdA/CDA1 family)